MKKIEVDVPPVLADDPTPKALVKQFHQRQIQVWEGEVPLSAVQGWLDNKRSNVLIRNWRLQYGRDPDNDELFQLVLADEGHGREDAGHKIQALARNIYQNGVRVPIILAADGRLLDGNRRYFASKLLQLREHGPDHDRFEMIPAWVLAKSCTAEDEENVITERNLVSDQKVEWPYYVKALQLYEDRYDHGLTVKEIAERYDWEASRVRAAIQAVELSQEFTAHHDDDPRAYEIAYRNLIWFDQLRRSHSKLLDQDTEFKEAVFDMMFEEPKKFGQARDFLKLGEIRASEEAWTKLRATPGPAGLQAALDQVGVERALNSKSPAGKFDQVIKLLADVVVHTETPLLEPARLGRFHELAAQVPAGPSQPEWQLARILVWLNKMTVEQVAQLSAADVANLELSMRRLDTMRASWAESGLNA